MLQKKLCEQTNTPKLNPGTVWDRYNVLNNLSLVQTRNCWSLKSSTRNWMRKKNIEKLLKSRKLHRKILILLDLKHKSIQKKISYLECKSPLRKTPTRFQRNLNLLKVRFILRKTFLSTRYTLKINSHLTQVFQRRM